MKYRGRTRFSTSFISSTLAWPETCSGGFMVPYKTSAPRRAMWSIMRKIAFSLPGMMRELSTTVSPFPPKCACDCPPLRATAPTSARPACPKSGSRLCRAPRPWRPAGAAGCRREFRAGRANAQSPSPNHAAADYGHAPAVFLRQIEHQLNAVDRRAEAGNHHAAVRRD